MNKWLVVTGIFLILIGVVAASSSNLNRKKIVDVLVVGEDNVESVSAQFVEGDKVLVNIWQGLDWPFGFFEPPLSPSDPENGLLFVYVDIIAPDSTVTRFEVQYTPPETPRTALSLWKINVTKQSAGLDPTSLYDCKKATYLGIGGVIKLNGNYTFKVSDIYPPRNYPPSRIEVRKGAIITEYPYAFLLGPGLFMTGTGAATTIFGFRRKKKGSFSRFKAKILLCINWLLSLIILRMMCFKYVLSFQK